ncbi:MAG TPA: hypothetical protein VF736_21090 [Pyrinomonadaceae bacterium]
MPQARTRSRRPKKADEEAGVREPSAAAASGDSARPQRVPPYARGLGTGVALFEQREQAAPSASEDEQQPAAAQEAPAPEGPAAGGEAEQAPAETAVTPFPDVSGVGPEGYDTAHGNSVSLQGRTDADFSNSTFRTEGVRTARGTGCANCEAGDCAHVRGTLVSTFAVSTTVTLPSVNDFPDLTPCQQRRVRDAITRVLAPHEQQHVAAFRTYNGTVRRPFDLTICRGDFDAAMQEMHDSAQAARQAAAQARSDALDPFNFNVDLDCEDPPARAPAPRRAGARADAGAPPPGPGESEEAEV